jgi:CspA family cold shock protein
VVGSRARTPEGQEESVIVVGTVKSYSREQGQGFIAVDGGQDVFVHFRAVRDSGLSELEPGHRVEFDVEEDQGHGHRAVHLRPIDAGK